MFDLGWSELLLIVAVAIIVIGPQDIPKVMYALGRVMRRIQYVRFAISQQFEDILREGDIEDIRKSVNFEVKDFDEAAADEIESLALTKPAASPETASAGPDRS